MKNKKAIVLPETLKIIIGVLCIIALIYLAVSLYGIMVKKTELIQARETLEQIVDTANRLEPQQTKDFLITAPKGRYLVEYYKSYGLLEKCNNKGCLCICSSKSGPAIKFGDEKYADAVPLDTYNFFNTVEGKKECEKGICINLNVSILRSFFYYTQGGAVIESKSPIHISWIHIEKVPKAIYLKRLPEGDVLIEDR